MSWTAIVPIKQGAHAKSRLGPILSPQGRTALAATMAAKVIAALRSTPCIKAISVLSSQEWMGDGAEWILDHGQGLNAELQRVREGMLERRLVIVHGDLPLVASDDIAAMCQAAEMSGIAIAPDRHGTGTNAIALDAHRSLTFAFGRASFDQHVEATQRHVSIVRRRGLEIDVDTVDDLSILGSPIDND